MEQIFAAETVPAYTTTWALAAIFPTLGIGCAVGLLLSRRRDAATQQQAETWETFYFFSRAGAITATTIARYLAAQPSSRVPPSVQLPVQHSTLTPPLMLRRHAHRALA